MDSNTFKVKQIIYFIEGVDPEHFSQEQTDQFKNLNGIVKEGTSTILIDTNQISS